MPTCECIRCGYKWESRKENPKKCCHCQSPLWDTPRKRKRSKPKEVSNVKTSPEVVPVTAEGMKTVPDEAKTVTVESQICDTTIADFREGLGLDRLKEARQKAEKLLEQIL